MRPSGRNRSKVPDIVANETLYQLSYDPIQNSRGNMRKPDFQASEFSCLLITLQFETSVGAKTQSKPQFFFARVNTCRANDWARIAPSVKTWCT